MSDKEKAVTYDDDELGTVPEGWPTPPEDLLESATNTALRILSPRGDHPAAERLRAYYSKRGRYAGATFAELLPTDPFQVSATDLLAVTLLSIEIRPLAARRLLDDGNHRNQVTQSLKYLDLDHDDLVYAGSKTLTHMASFYQVIKETVSDDAAKTSNPWVTASKICARKRPNLFPVRDKNVCDLLGLTKFRNYEIDWQVFRHLISNPEIVVAIDELTDEISEPGEVRVDTHRLRVLDAALWTTTVW